MKCIVIAAGYATRLGELTKNFPKPLLKIGNTTILDRMLDDIEAIPDISEVVIVTNHKFAHIFEAWAEERMANHPPKQGEREGLITILDDGTETNDTRLGAVCDLLLAIEMLDKRPLGSAKKIWTAGEIKSLPEQGDLEGLLSDLLVVAADNLLFFSFAEFVNFAKAKDSSCIMRHYQPSIEKLQRTGVVVLDENDKVLNMEEKPQDPKSHWAVPPFYIYKKKDLDLVRHSVENGCGKDAPGNLAHYMVNNATMYAWEMKRTDDNPNEPIRFDIGSLDTYKEACEKYGK